eukprot:scaffold33650_cov45-Phaeocystis_antarctica.AAC.2
MGSPMRTGAVRFVIDSSRPPDLRGSTANADTATSTETSAPCSAAAATAAAGRVKVAPPPPAVRWVPAR